LKKGVIGLYCWTGNISGKCENVEPLKEFKKRLVTENFDPLGTDFDYDEDDSGEPLFKRSRTVSCLLNLVAIIVFNVCEWHSKAILKLL